MPVAFNLRYKMDDRRSLNRPIKWRENEVLSLLELYKQYECLWNNKAPDYRNKYVRDKAYNHMIQSLDLNITVADLRKKIKGLRTTYNEELNKIANSIKNAAQADSVYKPSVFWFELADSFLRDVAERKKGEILWNRPPTESEDTTAQDSSKILPDYQDEDEDFEDTPTDDFYFEIPENRPRKKRAASPKFDKPPKSLVKNKKEDEIDLFGRFVVMQLRKLPEMAGLEVMQEFHRLLIDARKAHYSDPRVEAGTSFCSISSSGSKRRKMVDNVKIESDADPLDESD